MSKEHDEIMAELGRISRQVGDVAGEVGRLTEAVDRIDGRVARLEGKVDRLEGKVDTLQATVSEAVHAYAELWTGLRGAAAMLDVPDPEPGAPLEVELDELRDGMRGASRSLLGLPEPPKPEPPTPSPPKAKRSRSPKLDVLPGGRKNPGGPKRPRKPRGK